MRYWLDDEAGNFGGVLNRDVIDRALVTARSIYTKLQISKIQGDY